MSLIKVVTFLSIFIGVHSSATLSAAELRALVLLLGGQSNMQGFANASGLPAPYNTSLPAVQIWRQSTGSYTNLANGFGGSGVSNGGANAFGPELGFGHELASRFAGRDIYLIKYAVGGTSLSNDWDPNGADNPEYDTFVSHVSTALNSLDVSGVNYDVAGMLWMQGEEDSKLLGPAEAYEDNLNHFVANMRSLYIPNLPFVLGRLNDDLSLISGGINANGSIPASNPRFAKLDLVRAG